MSEFLYHYTTFDKFINGILRTNSLRLSPISKVNDPIDSKIRYFESDRVIFSDQVEGEAYHEIKNKYLKLINDKWIKNSKIICFSIDNPKESINGYQLSNLWSYYAQNHTGLCLKFNKEKLTQHFNNKFKQNTPLTGDIKYKDRLSSAEYSPDYNSNQELGIITNKDSLFFEKLKVWDREQEYRMICFSVNDYEYITLDTFLEEIILGQKSTEENELILKTNFSNLNICRMNYFIGDGKFEKIDIKSELWRFNSQV